MTGELEAVLGIGSFERRSYRDGPPFIPPAAGAGGPDHASGRAGKNLWGEPMSIGMVQKSALFRPAIVGGDGSLGREEQSPWQK